MDVERKLRSDLMEALLTGFFCWEEISLRRREGDIVRADVIGIPRDPEFSRFTLAFEVKTAPIAPQSESVDVSYWNNAIRQASNYVDASIVDVPGEEKMAGRTISAAFLYPMTFLPRRNIREEERATTSVCRLWGAIELAAKFRVGTARWEQYHNASRLTLELGQGSGIWRSDAGFFKLAPKILGDRRWVGSQRKGG